MRLFCSAKKILRGYFFSLLQQGNCHTRGKVIVLLGTLTLNSPAVCNFTENIISTIKILSKRLIRNYDKIMHKKRTRWGPKMGATKGGGVR